MMIEDIDIGEPHALQALIEAGQQIFTRAPIPIRPGPHIPACFGRDDEFVAVGKEVFLQDLTESFFRRSIRRAVIISEIEMCDAEIEGTAYHGARVFKVVDTTEVMPQPKRHGRKFDATAPGAAVLHGAITLVVGDVHNDFPQRLKAYFI